MGYRALFFVWDIGDMGAKALALMRPIYKLNRVESKLSSILFANVHFLLYLCGANGNILPGHSVSNN